MEDFELKFYELIGVRKFKDFLVNRLLIILLYPFTFFLSKEKRRKMIYWETSSNYVMNKKNGIKGVNNFKRMLLLNSFIHIVALILCIRPLLIAATTGRIIKDILLIIVNIYCIFIQRYNWIRIDKFVKKYKPLEDKKYEDLKEEIKELTKVLDEPLVKRINEDKSKAIPLEEELERASLEELRHYLSYFQKVDELIKLNENDGYRDDYIEDLKSKNHILNIKYHR